MKRKGLLLVVSAPSGTGKSTLCRKLFRRRKNLVFSVSVTTRSPRPGEKDGRDYFFVSDAAFRALRDRGDLVEWARVHDHFYGTPRAFLDRQRAAGRNVLLDIDVQGALQVKQHYPEAVLVFITPPRFAELERRLRHRRSENEAAMRLRLQDARRELRYVPRYDYVVVNDQILVALRKLEAILEAETIRNPYSENKGENIHDGLIP